MKATIICIGNRLIPKDAAGLEVFDRLKELVLPGDVDLVEGGLMGLNLLPLLERGGRVVFVDSVSGFTSEGTIVVLDRMDVIQSLTPDHYGHGAGLPYLLSILPGVCDGQMAEEIVLIGMEGNLSEPMIDRAAQLAVSIAINGLGESVGSSQ
jgi:hydrogenase maturation protease